MLALALFKFYLSDYFLRMCVNAELSQTKAAVTQNFSDSVMILRHTLKFFNNLNLTNNK